MYYDQDSLERTVCDLKIQCLSESAAGTELGSFSGETSFLTSS